MRPAGRKLEKGLGVNIAVILQEFSEFELGSEIKYLHTQDVLMNHILTAQLNMPI